jgi:hypothetical protein
MPSQKIFNGAMSSAGTPQSVVKVGSKAESAISAASKDYTTVLPQINE